MSAARAALVERVYIEANFEAGKMFHHAEFTVEQARSLMYALRDALREAGIELE